MKDDKPSGTALAIAAALVMLHSDPRSKELVPDFSAALASRCLEKCGGSPRRFLFVLRRSWFRWLAGVIQRVTVPGIVVHYATRKRGMNILARQAINGGINQAVVLGAGFDALAANLRRHFTGLNAWEIDHPATQRCKAAALSSLDINSLRLVAADLSTTSPQTALSTDPDFRMGEITLWAAEGLLMYFGPSNVTNVFEQTAAMSARGSRFLFTFMIPDRNGRLRFHEQTRLVDWWLRIGGEPFRWGTAPESLATFIHPWRVLRVFDSDGLKEMDPAAGGMLADGEAICLAEL